MIQFAAFFVAFLLLLLLNVRNIRRIATLEALVYDLERDVVDSWQQVSEVALSCKANLDTVDTLSDEGGPVEYH